MNQFKNRILATLTLFSSVSTLLCCALPALLVSLGAGAVMAGLVSTVPQLIIISRHKPTVFIIAGLLLVLSGFIQWRNRTTPCPLDAARASACQRLRKNSLIIFYTSLVAYITGVFFAFIAPVIF
jgi:hypothetical protein